MPNWCKNNVTFYHSDRSKIKELFISFYKHQALFELICPIPQVLKDTESVSYSDKSKQEEQTHKEEENIKLTGYKDWYDFCSEEWSTKWDVCNTVEILDEAELEKFEKECISIVSHEEEIQYAISFIFDTAWSPPINIYKKATILGFEVDATYYSLESYYCGIYRDNENISYDIPNTIEEVKESIPLSLDEFYGISDLIRVLDEINNK